MAKRDTGVGSKKQGHPHKTAKRLAAKQVMLEKKTKRHKLNRMFQKGVHARITKINEKNPSIFEVTHSFKKRIF